MKKLDQFLLKSFVGPFIAILAIVTFILVLQFLWLYIDELVDKGLEFKVILEFLEFSKQESDIIIRFKEDNYSCFAKT